MEVCIRSDVNVQLPHTQTEQSEHKCTNRLNKASMVLFAFDITKGLKVVVRRRVQHLDLSILFLRSFKQPTTNLSAIFTCSTLVVLKLRWLHVKLFSTVDLPFLKVLHLKNLTFPEHRCLAQLLSGCPVLEDFKARCMHFNNYSTHKEFKALPKLVIADISMAYNRFFLTEVVNNVEFLRIHYAMEYYKYTSPIDFPKFHNLGHIELVYNCRINDWLKVVELLKHCPKLQVLVINHPHSHAFDGIEEVGDWKYPSSVPECILLHLNRCYLKDYRGTKGEFQFARYMTQNGRCLKRMTICNGIAVNQQEKLKMLEKLYILIHDELYHL